MIIKFLLARDELNGLTLSGMVRVCLLWGIALGSANGGIGAACMLFLREPLKKQQWPKISYILTMVRKYQRGAALLSFVLVILGICLFLAAHLFLFNRPLFELKPGQKNTQHLWKIYLQFAIPLVIILSQDLFYLGTAGWKENLIIASDDNVLIELVKFICTIVAFTCVLLMLRHHTNFSLTFLPLLVSSFCKSIIVGFYFKWKYPHIHLLFSKHQSFLWQIKYYAGKITQETIFFWILINAYIIVFFITVGSQYTSWIIICNFFFFFIRNILIKIGNIYAIRLHYLPQNTQQKLNHFYRMLFWLVNCGLGLQLILVPYLVNIIFDTSLWPLSRPYDVAFDPDWFRTIFLEPWFFIIQTVSSNLIIIVELLRHKIKLFKKKVFFPRIFSVLFIFKLLIWIVVIPLFLTIFLHEIIVLFILLSLEIVFLCLAFILLLSHNLKHELDHFFFIMPKIWMLVFVTICFHSIVIALFIWVIFPNPWLTFRALNHELISAAFFWTLRKVLGVFFIGFFLHTVLLSLLLGFYRLRDVFTSKIQHRVFRQKKHLYQILRHKKHIKKIAIDQMVVKDHSQKKIM